MKKAIVTGATGFIGSELVKNLLRKNIEVLALGRKLWCDVDPLRLSEDAKLTYFQIDMAEIETLPQKILDVGWDVGDDCVFYNFAWGGVDKLSDLDVGAQMRNVGWTASALMSAAHLSCQRFIHVGTMEEPIAAIYLDLDYNVNSEFNRHVVYSLAKIASRNVVKVLAQKHTIDVMIATNSHVMGPNDDKDSFLQETLKKLKYGQDDLVFSTGEQLFDVISVSDCAEAYSLIGETGIPGSEYWIGSGAARPLKEYVEIMASMYPSGSALQFGKFPYNDISMQKEDFSIDLLVLHTGFSPKMTYTDTVNELFQWL